MNIDTFIAEIKAENESYDSAGTIDEASIYKWVFEALRPFGQNIMELQETVIDIDNSKGTLPDNFYSMYVGYKCDPKGYNIKSDDKSVVQSSHQWTERVERGHRWNSCGACCVDDNEKVITEKTYINDIEVDFYYEKPIPLRLGKSMRRDSCFSNCRNKVVKNSPYEIIINNRTIYTNFQEGSIYMQFYGLPLDEDGRPEIPEVGRRELERYVEYYVYMKLYEKLLRNNDAENIITLFQYYVRKEESQRGLALTDTKFSKLTPQSFYKIRDLNRRDMMVFELNFPMIK